MDQQITLPEPWSELRNDEDNFAVKAHIIYAAYAETLDLHRALVRHLAGTADRLSCASFDPEIFHAYRLR